MVLILYLQPGLAVIMIPGGILFLVITVVLRKPLKRFHKDVQEKDGKVRMYLQERISSMLVVRVFGAENIAVEQNIRYNYVSKAKTNEENKTMDNIYRRDHEMAYFSDDAVINQCCRQQKQRQNIKIRLPCMLLFS